MGLLTIAPIKHLNYRLKYTLNNMSRYHFGYTLACRIRCTLGYRLRYKSGNRVEYKTAYRLKGIRTKCHKSDTDKMPQNENRTKCYRIRMHQNCNNKSYNSVTKA